MKDLGSREHLRRAWAAVELAKIDFQGDDEMAKAFAEKAIEALQAFIDDKPFWN